MNIEILDSAQEDLIEGYKFYEKKVEGLGEYFLDSLFAEIDSLEFYAGIHPKRYGYHRLLTDKFPFAVYYKIRDKTVRIYAVLDCRQDPSWIRDRLT